MTKETIIDVSKQFRNLQTQYEKVVEQNRALQSELREKTAECEELKKAAFTLAEGLNFRQKKLEEIEIICEAQDLKVDWTALEILDIIKRTGGQRVKAERTRLMPAVQDAKQRKVKND